MAVHDNDDMRTPPQTEDAAERGWVRRDDRTGNPSSYRDLGQSDADDFEADDVGDIADEGPGHRG
jgi:hypothetical protein